MFVRLPVIVASSPGLRPRCHFAAVEKNREIKSGWRPGNEATVVVLKFMTLRQVALLTVYNHMNVDLSQHTGDYRQHPLIYTTCTASTGTFNLYVMMIAY